jgi:hypothetical protein
MTARVSWQSSIVTRISHKRWGRRSFCVVCLGESGRQTTNPDGLPHQVHTGSCEKSGVSSAAASGRNEQRWPLWAGAYPLLLLAVSSLFLCGCVNLLPVPRRNEKREAMALAATLKKFVPDSQALSADERSCANELEITVAESHGQMDLKVFGDKFRSYIDRLTAIRSKRLQIQTTVRQGVWSSPLVHVVQHNATVALQDQINRDSTWIQYVENVRLRLALGQHEEFPELSLLRHDLNVFLGQTAEDPLANQIRALQEEFRFGEGEVGP